MTDRISDTLCGYLEKLLVAQDEDIKKLQNEVAAYKANYKPLNDLIDRMEEDIDDLEHEVLGLKDQRALNHETIDKKNAIIREREADRAGMERVIRNLETQVLAVQIQAAESEHRADQERRGRLQLVMRM